MEFTAGGQTYRLAPLKFADVRDLRKSGAIKLLARVGEIEPWERGDVMAEIVAISARRAGQDVSAEALQEAMDPGDEVALLVAAGEVLKSSGFAAAEDAPPNAGSPGTSST